MSFRKIAPVKKQHCKPGKPGQGRKPAPKKPEPKRPVGHK